MADTPQTPAIGYMELVPQRDATTLLPVIQQHVFPGTTIWSDQWATYNNVGSLPGVAGHGVVKFKRMMGVSSAQLALHLDKLMWRERYGKTAGQTFNNVC